MSLIYQKEDKKMNKATIQRALCITKWSAQKGWSDEEFWEAIELLRSNQEDEMQTTEEKLDEIPITYDKTNDYPLMLTAYHISEILGISLRTTYEVMEEKGFPLVRIGRKKTAPKEAFLRWLEQRASAS